MQITATKPTTVRKEVIKKTLSYIEHSLIVWKHSNLPEASAKVRICESVLYQISILKKVESFSEVCSTIMRYKIKLNEILPSELNASYCSSRDSLNDILQACLIKKECLKTWSI